LSTWKQLLFGRFKIRIKQKYTYLQKKNYIKPISFAIQRGNAASIRGTFPDSALLSEIGQHYCKKRSPFKLETVSKCENFE
jgi:hypothetical protein